MGTNNEQLLNDEFYIGLRRRRATGQVNNLTLMLPSQEKSQNCRTFATNLLFYLREQEYAELLEEFMTAVKQNYGEKVLIQVWPLLTSESCVNQFLLQFRFLT